MQSNPTVRFMLVGDEKPAAFEWPANVAFHGVSLRQMWKRAKAALGAAPAAGLSVAGGASKISDLKPMLAHLFPELLTRCDFWGYLQEDQFLGDLRAFLDDDTLDRFDTISPLPYYLHAGPFMVYRHAPPIDALYRRSSQWRTAVTDPEYLAFDEWWGPRLDDDMPTVVRREAAAKRLRAYASRPHADSKVWLQDDYIYWGEGHAAGGGGKGGGGKGGGGGGKGGGGEAGGRGSGGKPTVGGYVAHLNESREFDEALVMTWRRGEDGIGRLWQGPGTDAVGTLWDGPQGQRALLHISTGGPRSNPALGCPPPSLRARPERDPSAAQWAASTAVPSPGCGRRPSSCATRPEPTTSRSAHSAYG